MFVCALRWVVLGTQPNPTHVCLGVDGWVPTTIGPVLRDGVRDRNPPHTHSSNGLGLNGLGRFGAVLAVIWDDFGRFG